MGPYEFRAEDAFRFSQEQGIKGRQQGDELQLYDCPYCHGASRGDKWKFAINLKTGAWNCKRGKCGAKGNMITLHKDFGFSLGRDADAYFDSGWQKFRNIHPKTKPEVRPPAVEYMESRGISRAVVERYLITCQKNKPGILVFPFYDENNVMQFVKYRNTEFDKEKGGSKEWCEANCKPILFGMNQCDPERSQTLVMTEGQIDSLSCTEAGILNAVSVPTGKNGFTWVPYCWDFLGRFDTLIIFGDCEKGEITLLAEMSARFHGKVMAVREADYRGCKDANDLLRKYGAAAVREAVEHAEPILTANIERLCDVVRKDMSKLERFSTGLKSLDRIIGGFYLGQLILLTGERGNGKSTLASQFGIMAIQAGYSVFFYSGELLDWYFRGWFEQQAAGPDYVNAIQRENGYMDYTVDGSIIPAMVKWYGDKAYFYTSSGVPDEDEGLLETMEKAVVQYGCKVLFVDNLMTAIEDDTASDLYRQQSNFVRKLAAMAKRFTVLIFLVAHPRKQTSRDFQNDDIAGSGNITNLADVVLRYDKPADSRDNPDTQDRALTVLKNRLTGRTERKGIPLYFEESSKRIAEWDNPKSFRWEAGWENDFFSADGSNAPFDEEVIF